MYIITKNNQKNFVAMNYEQTTKLVPDFVGNYRIGPYDYEYFKKVSDSIKLSSWSLYLTTYYQFGLYI